MRTKAQHLNFIAHIEELRVRILRIAFVLIGVMCFTYAHTDHILKVIARPVGQLVFTAPTEAFMTYLKVAFWSAVFLSVPYVLLEVWSFVGGALEQRERRCVLMALPASFLLFVVGVWFGFTFVISAGIKFLLSFGQGVMTPMLSVSHYVSFVGAMALSFGVVFQLPVVMGLLAKIGAVTPGMLASKRRFAVVIIFIVSGILTPSPDVFSQLCMAVPLLVLYEVSILVAWIIRRQDARAVAYAVRGGEVVA